ncbi:hypothetical protein OEZ86_012136 [Tetradesmus obliquus]|nr:hypothetical protein OEZ86_012136 [Tetradesmus obliquus]
MTLVVDAAAQTATYSLMMYNINGYTMSHIHKGNSTTSGPPVVLLLPGLKAGQNTTIAAADLPTIAPIDICSMTYTSKFAAADLVQLNGVAFSWTDFMTNLAAGTLYANIHTVTAPAGLIRGQFMPIKGWKSNVKASCGDREGWKLGK